MFLERDKTTILSFPHVLSGNPIGVFDSTFRGFPIEALGNDRLWDFFFLHIPSSISPLTFHIFTIHIANSQSRRTECHHSYLRDSTGFAKAAFIACELTVSMAINNAIPPDNKKTHQLKSVL